MPTGDVIPTSLKVTGVRVRAFVASLLKSWAGFLTNYRDLGGRGWLCDFPGSSLIGAVTVQPTGTLHIGLERPSINNTRLHLFGSWNFLNKDFLIRTI